MPSLGELEAHREYLFGIAYRMLGAAADAEDIVQEALLRAERAGTEELRAPRAFLSRTVTRLCIDHLRSARVRRESYVGPWLPEPLVWEQAADPLESTLLAESLSLAFLVLLESLNPVERAVYLLREVFEFDYPEVAEIVGRSEANCRQIAHRAREYVLARKPRFEASQEQRVRLAERFAAACAGGDLQTLTSLLHREITLWSDGGGKVPAALNPIYGPDRVGRFLQGIWRKGGAAAVFRPVWINCELGFMGARNGELWGATALEVRDGLISGIRIIRNPEKLPRVAALARECGLAA